MSTTPPSINWDGLSYGTMSFVSITRRGDALLATIAGPHVGLRESQVIVRELHAAIREEPRLSRLVLDVTEVMSMSSLGLGMCIEVRNAARKRGAETAIIGLRRGLADLFRMMKLDRLFTIEERDQHRTKRRKP